MLTGELPFNAPTVAGILMKQITEPAPDIRAAARRRARGPGAGREPLPGEGSGEPLAERRRAPPGAREPHGRRVPADRHLLQGAALDAPAEPRPLAGGGARAPAAGTGRRAGSSRGRRFGPRPLPAPRGTSAGLAPARLPRAPARARIRCPTPASRGSSRRCAGSSRAGRRSRSAASASTSPRGSATRGSCSRRSAWASACSGATPSSGRRGTAGGTC